MCETSTETVMLADEVEMRMTFEELEEGADETEIMIDVFFISKRYRLEFAAKMKALVNKYII